MPAISLASCGAPPPPVASCWRSLAISCSRRLRSVGERGEALGEVGGRHLEGGRGLGEQALLVLDVAPGGLAGQRLDAADAGGDRALGGDLEQRDVAGARAMRAAAELDRGGAAVGLAAHRDDAHLVAVLLAEQRHGAGADRGLAVHQADPDGGVLAQERIDLGLDRGELGRRHGLRVAEVEAQAVGRDQRALLRDVAAEVAAQRRVQQVRRRVGAAQAGAALVVDPELDRVADRERAALEAADVDEEVAADLLLGVGDLDRRAGPRRIVPVSPIWPPDSP